ncbi:hypothetical protein VP424E501_P0154 [Vibrio phage 424E50-1]|nr:hypothetical protein VP424E501_P0154 [Vibrio phage 424E50-1]
MKHVLSTSTENALQMLENVLPKISDSHHWIGTNSIRLNRQETINFINNKLTGHKHLTVRQYENRVCVDLGLSGRNNLHIDLN